MMIRKLSHLPVLLEDKKPGTPLRKWMAGLSAGWLLAGGVRVTALAQPALRVALQPGHTIRVSWPRSASTYTLESAVEVGQAALWRRLDLPETVTEAEVVVTLSPGAATRFFRLRETGLTRLVSVSPDDGEPGVSVTRETILHFDRPLAADTVLTLDRLHAEADGRRLLGRVELSSDRRTVTLFPLEPLPGSSRVTVSFDSNGLLDQVGAPVDGDRDGQPGGVGVWSFETLSTTPLAGTVVVGRVFAAELVAGPDTGTNAVNRPLAGVTITVDGREQDLRTTTVIDGHGL